jgi:hypothetical protein
MSWFAGADLIVLDGGFATVDVFARRGWVGHSTRRVCFGADVDRDLHRVPCGVWRQARCTRCVGAGVRAGAGRAGRVAGGPDQGYGRRGHCRALVGCRPGRACRWAGPGRASPAGQRLDGARALRLACHRAAVVAALLASWPTDPFARTGEECSALRAVLPDGVDNATIRNRTRQITTFVTERGRLPADLCDLETRSWCGCAATANYSTPRLTI